MPPLPVRIGSPAALLAVIPGLLGFAPGHSIVILGTEPPGAQVRLTLRYDMPAPAHPAPVHPAPVHPAPVHPAPVHPAPVHPAPGQPGPARRDTAAGLAAHAVSVLAAQGVTAAVAVGYGTDAEVAPVAAALRERAAAAGIAVTELLRVTDRRYWSYVCTDPECCPPEGTTFEVAGHPAASALGSRAELAASVAAADGKRGAAMQRATKRAHAHVARCAARLDRAGLRVSLSRLTAALGQLAVEDAIRRCRDGDLVGGDHAAWLTVALREIRVRDDAWARMDVDHRAAHQRLWVHLTRLARPGYVAAPASLLAFVAWQNGDGALANVALDRALTDNPRYSMAKLLRQALDSGAPPSMARLPMTPEEVAAAYDAAEEETAARLR